MPTRNPLSKRNQRRRYVMRKRKKTQAHLLAVKRRACCAHCGCSDPDVLQAHHVDRASKSCEVAQTRESWAAMERELAKCIWLCANCHLRLTVREKHWQTRRRPATLDHAEAGSCPCEIVDRYRPAGALPSKH